MNHTRPPGRILRVGRKPNPWAWPPWEIAGEDGTFGNRWDDARSTYRVLYASSQLEACFVETLARFRPDPHVLAGLARIEGPEPLRPAGRLPRSWLTGRVVGEASVPGVFCDVGAAASLHPLYWGGLAVVAALLLWQHALLAGGDLSRVGMAFFNANGLISVVYFGVILACVALR